MDYTKNGKCAPNCGECCTCLLPLSKREEGNIKSYLSTHDIKPGENIRMCPFLGENKKCTIYECRPDICKAFICNKPLRNFDHRDKTIVDFWKVFFPNRVWFLSDDRAKKMNELYEIKKEKIIKNNIESKRNLKGGRVI